MTVGDNGYETTGKTDPGIFSPLSRRFYASRAYREEGPGIIMITG